MENVLQSAARMAGCLLAATPSLACDRIVGLTPNYYETTCSRLDPQPLFCEDFDEPSYDPKVVWNNTSSTAGALAVDMTEYRSYPASLLAQSTSTTNGTINVAAFRTFSLTGPTIAGALDLDIMVDQEDAASGAQAVLAQVGLESNTSAYWLQFVVTSSGSGPLVCTLNEVGATDSPIGGVWTHPVSQSLVPGTWRHVTLAVTAPLAGGQGSATLSFDGVQVGNAPMIDVPAQNYQTIGVGLAWASTPSTGWTVHYDNIVFGSTAETLGLGQDR